MWANRLKVRSQLAARENRYAKTPRFTGLLRGDLVEWEQREKRLAVAAVWCPQFSVEFPAYQRICREFSRFWADLSHCNVLKAVVYVAFSAKFPMRRSSVFPVACSEPSQAEQGFKMHLPRSVILPSLSSCAH
jgi:hypothetical protein